MTRLFRLRRVNIAPQTLHRVQRLLILALFMATTAFGQQSDNYRSQLRNRNVKVTETHLPLVFISVGGRMILRDSYILGQIKIIHNGDGQMNYGDTVAHPGQHIDHEGYIALKYRGNSSFDQSGKKPMAFRTLETNVLPDYGGAKKKVCLLGMAKDSKWGFIAPWADEVMFRDVLAFELARPWMDWVPEARMCEVILDGTYYGVYVLCERVSKGKNRLDLDDPTLDDIGNIVADWHVSVDHGYDPYFTSKYHPWQSLDGQKVATWYTIKYEYGDPDDDDFWQLPQGSRQALTSEVDRMEASFMADNWLDPDEGYRKYVDPMSFIDYMLATELSMNIDGYRLSTHLYKHSQARAEHEGIDPRWKLTLWDFNIAWGNANYYDGSRTDRWQYMLNVNFTGDNCPVPFYWYRLLQDEDYVSAMKLRWQAYRQSNHSDERLIATIDSLASLLTASEATTRNEQAWGIFTRSNIWPLPYYANSYDDAVSHLKDWVRQRLRFLDKHLLPPRVIETEPIDISSGFTDDIVAESLPANQFTTTAVDGSERTFYSALLRGSGGLPADRLIISGNEQVHYHLADYNSSNALTLKSPGSNGTLELAKPIQTSEIFVLATSGNGASKLEVRLNYTDGTTDVAGNFDVRDWSVRQPQGDEAVTALGNIQRNNNGYSSDNHYCLFDFSVPVDKERILMSVTFYSTNWAYASVMALSSLIDDTQGIDFAHIESIQHLTPGPQRIYGADGSRQNELRRGLNIVRSRDGRVRKVLKR